MMNNPMMGMGNPMGGFGVPAVQDSGGAVNVFGDMTIIHTQQFQPANPYNESMRLMNEQMRQMNQIMAQRGQLALEQQKIALENKKLDLAERAMRLGVNNSSDMQPQVLDNPKEKIAIGSSSFNNVEEVEEAEVVGIGEPQIKYEVKDDIGKTEEFHFKDNSYLNLDAYFDINGELNSSLKVSLLNNSSSGFKGEGGRDKPVLLFLRYSNTKIGITDFWRKEFRNAIFNHKKAVFKRAGFITDTSNFIIFIFDSGLRSMDIVHVRSVPFEIFPKVKAKEQVENYSAGRDFYNWIMDDNELIKHNRVNSVQIVAEPILNTVKTSDGSIIHFNTRHPETQLNEIVKDSLFEDRQYSIDLEDLLDKSMIVEFR